MNRILLAAVLSSSLLSGCDMLGIDSPEKVAAAKDADGRAIGAACRQSGRAIEDCYFMNKKAEKASVFAGWKDMNDYMRENKIAEVVPQLSGAPKPPAPKPDGDDAKVAEADDSAASKPAPAKPKAPKVVKEAKAASEAKEAKSTSEPTTAGS